jgi:hypothetical protein
MVFVPVDVFLVLSYYCGAVVPNSSPIYSMQFSLLITQVTIYRPPAYIEASLCSNGP